MTTQPNYDPLQPFFQPYLPLNSSQNEQKTMKLKVFYFVKFNWISLSDDVQRGALYKKQKKTTMRNEYVQ